ncbi:MAG: DUF1648 domain-containing protein [Microbacterium sp.]
MTTPTLRSADVRRARTAFLRVGVFVPLAVLVLSAVVILAWLPELPDPAAMHWGSDGVDGFGPRWTVLITPLIGVGVVLLFAGIALAASRMQPNRGQAPWWVTSRLLGAVNLGVACFMAMLSVIVAGVQRGLADAADAPDITSWTFLGFGVMAALAVVGWFLQPRVEPPHPETSAPSALPLTPTERAAWFGTVSVSRPGRVVLGVLSFLVLCLTVLVLASEPRGAASWIMLGSCLLLVVLVGTTLAFRVRVNADGLRVRSLAGWPNLRIPLAEVAKVEVVELNPFGEFGGWGWRLALDGRRGVVLRTGEALQITRTNGAIFVVTVDGAAEAASVLEALRSAAS